MLVLIQVSSMKTSRETSTRFWRLRQRALWRVMSARSRSRAMSVFFVRDAEAAEEAAHHRGVDPDSALGQQPVAKRLKGDV